MAKKTEAQIKAEEEANQRLTEETVRLSQEVGQDDASWLEGANEADPFEKMPTFMPGKPGFDTIGKGFLGEYVRTKIVVNEDSPWARVDNDPKSATYGKKIVHLVVFRDAKGNPFGIWGVGAIRAAAQCLRAGDKVKITYEGVADVPLKPGQNPPHTFKFVGKRADGSPLRFDWDAIDEATGTGAGMTAPEARQ